MTLLLRPNSKSNNYQKLAHSVAAIEPPIWMALRAQHLRNSGKNVRVVDLEVSKLEHIYRLDSIEIFPTGNHPSAFIQHKDGVIALIDFLKKNFDVAEPVVWDRIPDFGEETHPAWDLFNLNKYRAHNWHCWGRKSRSPYGVVATSLSCPYNCSFCCIKSFYGEYKELPIDKVLCEFDYLGKNNISNIKIIDELFFYRPERVEEICRGIIKLKHKFNIWAYARIDTIKPELLPLLKKAGFNWLGIGIESGNEKIRQEALKGRFTNQEIKDIIHEIRNNGLFVGVNFIFGFLQDNLETLQETLEFAKELNCEYTNFYTMMAYPNSQLFRETQERGWELPQTWTGYSQYSYDSLPVRTEYLSSAEILAFRDKAFKDFYTSNRYLTMIKQTFGMRTVREIKEITKIKLHRKLLETIKNNK